MPDQLPMPPGVRAARGPTVADMLAKARCPFGCAKHDDENRDPDGPVASETGTCRHLVGFAHPGSKEMEVRQFKAKLNKDKQPTGEYREIVSGKKRGRQPIPAGAERVQIGNTVRIYTKKGIEDYDKYVHPDDFEEDEVEEDDDSET